MSVGEIAGFLLWAAAVGVTHWWARRDPRTVLQRRQDKSDLRRIRASQRRVA